MVVKPNKKVLMLGIGYGELGGVGTVTKELTETLNSRGDHEVDVLSYWPWHMQKGRKPLSFKAADGTETAYDSLDEFIASQEGNRDYDILQLHSHIFSDHYLEMMPDNTIGTSDFLDRYNAPKALLTHSLIARENVINNITSNNTQLESQRQIMELSDVIIHLTEDQRRFAKKVWPDLDDRTTVIGNGTNFPTKMGESEVSDLRSRLAPNNEKLGLYLGRISSEKGALELARALPLIKIKHPEFKLLIAGNRDGNERDLIRIFDDFGLKEGTDYQFMGWISDPKYKQALIRATDYTIMPSYWEHFPMAALESMINYTPVIMTDVEGPRSAFNLRDPNRRLALPIEKIKDPSSIASAINYALENGDEMHKIRERAMSQVYDKYTWNIVAEEYSDLYDCMIEGNGNITRSQSRSSINEFVSSTQRSDEDRLFDLQFNRDFAIRQGNNTEAYQIALQIQSIDPSPVNEIYVRALETSI